MFVCTMEDGMTMAMPDVCLTPAPPAPPLPIPYPNMGQLMMATPPVPTVLVCGVPALNKASMVAISSGDEPGVNGGVISGVFIGPVEFVMGSMVVTIGGQPAVRLGDPIKGNDGNAFGSVIVPSQPLVMAS